MVDQVFDKIKKSLLNIDPVNWAESFLTLDGKPYRITDSGYRPLAEILRYMCIKGLEKDAKPMVWSKSRQIAGTSTAAVAEMYFMGSGLFANGDNPPMRLIHCWPFIDKAANYSKTKLASFIDSSVMVDDGKKGKRPIMKTLLDNNSTSNDNIRFKQFKGGNHIWVESIGLDGGRIRGLTVDYMFFDEVQDMLPAAIANTTKAMIKSQYGSVGEGVQVYFGTPKMKGSAFWDMWNKSSQQYFHLGCFSCKKDFALYSPGSNAWEKVWLYGNVVKCSHCGCEQDRSEAINRGKWVAYRDPADAVFVGFHLNQLFLPEFTKEKIIAAKPENSAVNTERAYQNEVLGEFFHGDAGIISTDEIREKCGDPERRFRSSITEKDQMITFLGIDIGAKSDIEQLADADKVKVQGQSYSVAVVLGFTHVGRLSIEFATKFKKNDLNSQKGIIDEIMKKYNCKLGVCDIGYAGPLNEILQTEYGERFLSSESTGKVNNHIKYNNDRFPKMITFEKDYWIMEMYDQLKKGAIRFPLGSYEQIAWLMQHCANMEIKPSISRYGIVSPHYVKSGNNDGFAALINAYLAYKFYISKGFTITNPLQQTLDSKTKEKPKVILGYVPYKKNY